ncbi:MAG: hypothetical protein KGM16_13800 [Bacteroidota bacterium]|nr:hypothetical protein [Bacteroidota bacterium]
MILYQKATYLNWERHCLMQLLITRRKSRGSPYKKTCCELILAGIDI